MEFRHGLFFVSAAALFLAGCIPSPDGAARRPVQRQSPALPDNAILKACVGQLERIGARFSILPDQYAGNCSAINTVKLTSAGVEVTNLTATQCPMARAFATWVQGDVQRAAREAFGKSVMRVETMGSYACRSVKGVASNRLSEHAFANAIDVSGFILTDGRRVTLAADWNGARDTTAFLRAVRDEACKRFRTVLSPDYNAAHYNHLHFDMADPTRSKGAYCR
jgi:hypothetical protein